MNIEKKMALAFWWAFMVFLIPSIPHMATIFRSWEPVYGSDLIGNISSGFWWVVSVLGAIVIDGTIIYLSRIIASEVERASKNWAYVLLLGAFVVSLTAFSWQMNIWYAEMNVQIAAAALGSAYNSKVLGLWDSSTLMPYMVSALPVLGIMFTIMAGKIKQAQQSGVEGVMTDEQFEIEKTRIRRQQELKKLKSNNQGVLSLGKEALLGKSKTDEERRASILNAAIDFLRNAVELLEPENEERAIEAIARYLKINQKEVLPYLIAARSTIQSEQNSDYQERDTDKLSVVNAGMEEEQDSMEEPSITDPLAGLQGRDTVNLEIAATALNCQVKHVITLRNEGKLKHASKNERLITVSSLRQYMAKRRPMNRSTSVIEQPTRELTMVG